MKAIQNLSPQRHRDTENFKTKKPLPGGCLTSIPLPCFSLCLCVSVVDVLALGVLP